jgi:hypothetical protein
MVAGSALLSFACSVVLSTGELNVLVVGDSFGDTGPTYRALDDAFLYNGVPATVKSTAVGGTTCCHWASQESGMKLVNDAKQEFPDAAEGPDYMWFTLGANDQWSDGDFQACLKSAHGGSFQDALDCLPAEVERVSGCAQTLLENYWKVFPKSKVLFTGYDIPSFGLLCDPVTEAFFGKFCGSDVSCSNQLEVEVQKRYSAALIQKFANYPFTAASFIGAAQKGSGIAGADVGTPVIAQGVPEKKHRVVRASEVWNACRRCLDRCVLGQVLEVPSGCFGAGQRERDGFNSCVGRHHLDS